MDEVTVVNHGSMVFLYPTTTRAHKWMDTQLPEAIWMGGGVVVEERYVDDIVEAISADFDEDDIL